MDQIIKANPELKERKLNWRDVLRIPQIETVVKAESEEEAPVKRFVEHEVEKGETLWSVSREYGVTVEDILAANPDAQKGIKRNKTLRIPVFPEETKPEAEGIENDTIDEVEAGNTVVKITGASQICAEGDHSREFMVALMLPLYLDEETPENYQDTRSLRFLDFYKGTLMAMDSLAAMGMKVNLKVYDVDDSYGKISAALNDPELEQADLIVGPLFRNSFLQVAEFASKHEIPIVNPLTKSDNVIRSNENVFKVQVPEEIHLKLIAHSIRKHYPDANIVLVRHNPYQDKERADAIREALNGKLKDRVLLPNSYLYNLLVEKSYNDTSMHDGELFDTIYIENTMFKEDFLNQEIMSYTTFPNKIHDLIYTNDTIYGFTKYASLARKNIFVSLTDDKVFTMEVLSRLNSLKDTFDLTVYTLPGVFEYELETDFLASMDMHVSASGYLDFGTPDFEAFEDAYFDRWGHYPENHIYACLAYDIGMYFGSALYRFGSEFGRCLPNHPYESLYMNFFFVGKEGQGYENGFASIYRIKDFHFVPEEELLYSGE
jgi:LysM repeat protein